MCCALNLCFPYSRWRRDLPVHGSFWKTHVSSQMNTFLNKSGSWFNRSSVIEQISLLASFWPWVRLLGTKFSHTVDLFKSLCKICWTVSYWYLLFLLLLSHSDVWPSWWFTWLLARFLQFWMHWNALLVYNLQLLLNSRNNFFATEKWLHEAYNYPRSHCLTFRLMSSMHNLLLAATKTKVNKFLRKERLTFHRVYTAFIIFPYIKYTKNDYSTGSISFTTLQILHQ